MTTTLIALISVLLGITGALVCGLIFKKYSLGLIGNTIMGVFGSVFFIKSLGHLGFDPASIMSSGTLHMGWWLLNITVSFAGGALAVFLMSYLKNKMIA